MIANCARHPAGVVVSGVWQMPVSISIKADIDRLTRALGEIGSERVQKASAHALNNAAFAARAEVQSQIKKVFRDPKPITVNSVLVRKVNVETPVPDQVAEVWINDRLSGGVAPSKWLGVEESGGNRAMKRMERALGSRGLMGSLQFAVPARGAVLDGYGQPSGSAITMMLSRLGALSETGYLANSKGVDAFRRKARRDAGAKLGKGASREERAAARAGAYIPATKQTGTDFFVARARGGEPMGIFRLNGRGSVSPVWWFSRKTPGYKPKFPFQTIARLAARDALDKSFDLAMRYIKGG